MLLQKTLVLRYCGAFDSPRLAKRFDGATTESADKRLHEQILQPFKSLFQLREGRQASILFDVKREKTSEEKNKIAVSKKCKIPFKIDVSD